MINKIKNEQDMKLFIRNKYDTYYENFEKFSLKDLLKEQKITMSELLSTELRMSKCNSDYINSKTMMALSMINFLLLLCNFIYSCIKAYDIIVLLMVGIFTLAFIMMAITIMAIKKYDKIEKNYLFKKLKLEVINQLLAEKQSSEKN